MAKFHVNTETGRYGPCSAKPDNCPLKHEAEHFHSEEEAVQKSEQVLAEKHGVTKTLKKNKTQAKSLRNSLIDDFRKQSELAKENNDLQSAATFNQFANFANNCHNMSNSQTISYMSNMIDLEGNENPKVKEIAENIILESSEKFKDYTEFKPVNLPFEVIQHPKGYDFYKAMENATTSEEQMRIVRNFDYDGADISLIRGEGTQDLMDSLYKQRGDEFHFYSYSKDTLEPETSFVAIQEENKNYTVWLLGEDGEYIGTVYNTNKDEAYEKIREVYVSSLK